MMILETIPEIIQDIIGFTSGMTVTSTIIEWVISIVGAIYYFVNIVYQIFLCVAENNIFSPDLYDKFFQKIYMILGVVMLFILAYNILTMIIDPEKNKGGKEVEKILLNLVVTFVAIALCPTIFRFAYNIQNSFLNSNVISNFFNNESVDTYDQLTGGTISSGGKLFSLSVFSAFFRAADTYETDGKIDTITDFVEFISGKNKTTLETMQEREKNVKNHSTIFKDLAHLFTGDPTAALDTFVGIFEGSYLYLSRKAGGEGETVIASGNGLYLKWVNCLCYETCNLNEAKQVALQYGTYNVFKAFSGNVVDGTVEFNFLLAIIAGCYLLYVIVSFTFDVAVRVCKLALYQIIAPICISCRLLPKQDGIYKNWLSAVIKTYLSVFIRVFIMSLGVYLLSAFAQSNFSTLCVGCTPFSGITFFTNAFVVLGVVTFVKKAPQLIDEIFNLGKDVKLNLKEKVKESGLYTGLAVAGSAITAGVKSGYSTYKDGKGQPYNGINTAVSSLGGGIYGAFTGFKNGGKNAGSMSDVMKASTSGAQKVMHDKSAVEKFIANHPDSKSGTPTVGSVAGGVKDYIQRRFENWYGKNNVEDLKIQNASISNVLGAEDALKNAVEKGLISSSRKGEELDFHITEEYSKTINGKTVSNLNYSPLILKQIEDLKNEAERSGNLQEFNGQSWNAADLESLYNTYLKDYTKLVADKQLMSEEHFKAVDQNGNHMYMDNNTYEWMIKNGREESNIYRETVKNNINDETFKVANELAQKNGGQQINAATIDGDLTIGKHSALDFYEIVGLERKIENNNRIREIINQEESSKK